MLKFKMCKWQCLLAVAVLYVGLAHSWDIAISVGNQLIFYTNGTRTNTVNLISHNATALAYDEVHSMVLYVDKKSNNDSICGYNLFSKENKCFIKRLGSNIHSIAYDPATDTLFFTDTNERSINWISFKPGSNKNVDGNLLIKMDDRTPTHIAVDSCRGYIYWANTDKFGLAYIERARFNGSERKVIFQHTTYNTILVYSMAMDPQTRNVYYIDGHAGRHVVIRSLDGQQSYIALYVTYLSNAKELAVSNAYVYWMNSSVSYKKVWRMPKDMLNRKEIKEIRMFYNETPLAMVANYKIKDQIQGLQDCEALSSLRPTITVTSNSLNIQHTTETEQTTESSTVTVVELVCVHGIKVSETSVCKCTPGYIGGRCDVSVCENYCLQGNCSFNHEGLPKCRCNAGYSGERCEVYACHGFCLNSGNCSLNEKTEPVCQCKRDYLGARCEVLDCLNYCMHGECSFNEEGVPTCRCNAGYSGDRCEVYACHGYCLNNGDCSLNEEDQPVCQCVGNHEGTRCEAATNEAFTNTPTFDSVKRNLTLAELLSNWRKPTSKMFITVEV